MSSRWTSLIPKVDEKEALEHLQGLLRIPSPTGEEGDIGKFLAQSMKEMGFEAELHEVARDRFNVLGAVKGDGSGYSIILTAHTDTSPTIPDKWTMDPFGGVVKDGNVYGHGVRDVKAGVSAMTMAAKLLMDSKTRMRGNIFVAPVIGHREYAIGAANLLERGIKAEFAVCAEPTDLKPCIANRGWIYLDVLTSGKSDHTTKRDNKTLDKDVNAIVRMAKVVEALADTKFRSPGTLTWVRKFLPGPVAYFNMGKIEGGREPNYIPDFCRLTIDARFISGKDWRELVDEVRERIKKAERVFNGKAKVSVRTGFPIPAFAVHPKSPIVKASLRAKEYVDGRTGPLIGKQWTSDAGRFQEAGVDSVVLGPGEYPHWGPDSYVSVKEYLRAIRIYARLAAEVAGRSREEFNKIYGKG